MVMLCSQHLEAVERDVITLMRNGAWTLSESFLLTKLLTQPASKCSLHVTSRLFHTTKFHYGFAF